MAALNIDHYHGNSAVMFILVAILLQLSGTSATEPVYSTPPPINKTLYFASQGFYMGSRSFTGGLYGGLIDHRDNGNSFNFSLVKLECFTDTQLIREDYLKTRGISYDPVQDKVLLHLYDRRRTTVFVLPRCYYVDPCNYDVMKNNEELQAWPVFSFAVSSDRADVCKTELQPFALYDLATFFVARRIAKVGGVSVLRLELRRMFGCEYEIFHSQNPFKIERCSLLVAVLYETTPSMCEMIHAGHHLRITRDKNTGGVKKDGSGLLFFVQMFNRTSNDFSVSLLMARRGHPTRVLHKTDLPYSLHDFTDIGRHLGGIDVNFDKLCWSAVAMIYCGDWDGEILSHVEAMLEPDQAAGTVCNVGADGPVHLSNITTGVAIANYDTNRGISVYFGCEQEEEEYGGGGLLQMYPYTGASILYPLRENHRYKIHAGAMFLADVCPPGAAVQHTLSVFISTSTFFIHTFFILNFLLHRWM